MLVTRVLRAAPHPPVSASSAAMTAPPPPPASPPPVLSPQETVLSTPALFSETMNANRTGFMVEMLWWLALVRNGGLEAAL